jgi:hypothetical protein
MDRSSSIFSFEIWRGLRESYREAPVRWDGPRLVLLTVSLMAAACIASLTPNEVYWGRWSINADIRVAHDPASPTAPGICETTEDGLWFYPGPNHPRKQILIIGNSTSDWHRFPQWVDRLSAEEGSRIEVYSAAQLGADLYEMEDTLRYILENNGRGFDAVLINPSFGLIGNLIRPPEDRYRHPPLGSGFSLRSAGAPADATATSFADHFEATWKRRKADLRVREINLARNRLVDYNRPTVENPVCSESIPAEMERDLEILQGHYREGIQGLIDACRERELSVFLMTSECRPYSPGDPAFEEERFLSLYQGKYIFACFQHRLQRMANDWLREMAAEEGVPLIDSAQYIRSRGGDQLFVDFIHLKVGQERPHGAFVLGELRRHGV